MAHVNVLQTLVLEHRELAELNNNRMLCVCVGGGGTELYSLCVKTELKEDLFWYLPPFHSGMLVALTFIFYLAKALFLIL